MLYVKYKVLVIDSVGINQKKSDTVYNEFIEIRNKYIQWFHTIGNLYP